MQYRTFKKTGEKISLLGIGTMRLPLTANGKIDRPQTIDMIRTAIDEGNVNYVDTAYMYHDGESEVVTGLALKDGYREKVFVADKMPVWLANSEAEMQSIFYKQLERLDIDCIDFYLVHNITRQIWELAKKYNTLEFLEQMRSEGKIKHLGFSFHDECDFFKEVIDSYSWDFCQIQFNYMDKNLQAGIEGLKYAGSKDIPVIIMEPLKGGKLTDNVPPAVTQLWNTAAVKRTPAAWGLRWVANFPEVMIILSGMHSMDQIKENISILSEASPNSLTTKEHDIINAASDKYNSLIQYSCTGCRYCMPCPQKIDIPFAIDSYNQLFLYNNENKTRIDYNGNSIEGQRASACITCRQCESHCPQHLPISEIMEKVAASLEK